MTKAVVGSMGLGTFLCLALAACSNPKTKPTDENFTETLNNYFLDHPDCLLHAEETFPMETADPERARQFDTLVAAQILEAHREPAIHVSRYTLTTVGQRVGGHLCYGHREITAILSHTPPVKANGFVETQVVYRYRVADLPIWAKTPGVAEAFPVMGHETSGDATDKITLALTGVGWSVPE